MKKLLLLVGLGVLVLTPRLAGAQTLSIDHQPVGCAVAEKFPRLEARFAPADTVAVARVLFQAENAQQWYAVAMKAEGSAFSGVLPKPKKSLKTFRYYIEVTDKALGTNRTADYTTNVVGGSGECKGKLMAGALGSAAVLLQVPAGAAALPAGFASAGVVAAGSGSAAAATGAAASGGGGGLGTGAIVGIVAGAGAAAAGVVVAASKGGAEAVSDTSYSGQLTGQYTVTQTVVGNVTNVCSFLRSLSGTMKVTLRQGSGSPGEAQLDLAENAISASGTGCNGSGPGCCGPNTFMCVLTGTPGSLACGEQRTNTISGGSNTQSFTFSGSLSGGVVSGVVTYGRTGQSTINISNETHTGSTSITVTLR